MGTTFNQVLIMYQIKLESFMHTIQFSILIFFYFKSYFCDISKFFLVIRTKQNKTKLSFKSNNQNKQSDENKKRWQNNNLASNFIFDLKINFEPLRKPKKTRRKNTQNRKSSKMGFFVLKINRLKKVQRWDVGATRAPRLGEWLRRTSVCDLLWAASDV